MNYIIVNFCETLNGLVNSVAAYFLFVQITNSVFEEALIDLVITNVSELDSYFTEIFPVDHAASNLLVVPVKNVNCEVGLFCCLLDYPLGNEEFYKELIVECFR